MKKLFYSGIFLLLAACNSGKEAVMTYSSIKEKSNDFLLSGKLFSCLYHQQAAEYDALCYQAYNLARLRLDESTPMCSTQYWRELMINCRTMGVEEFTEFP